MFDWLRKIVAGPKNRTVSEDYDLDLTYITPNVIAMAFPATGIQKLVRNCLEDVVSFLQQNHKGKYYIINVSNRQYDTSPFEGRVKSYDWDDHQAPCLTTLFDICELTSKHLKSNEDNVVVFHCNHGKGRTGTAIMSLLMYIQEFQNQNAVLDFYNEKRFKTKQYVCSQPCQIRYLKFYNQILKNPHKFQIIRAYRLNNVKHQGLSDNYYLTITEMRRNKVIYSKINVDKFEKKKQDNICMGDIFIQIYKSGLMIDTRVCRINFNMQFTEKRDNKWTVFFQGANLTLQKCQSSNFSLQLQFQQNCECYSRQKWKSDCICFKKRQQQQWHWSKMHHTINNRSRRLSNEYTFANINSKSEENLVL